MIMKAKRKAFPNCRLRDEKGISAVEFAMVLPIFLIIFLGIIEYGWVMTHQIVLAHAVSEGARAAIKMPDGTSDDDLAAAARTAAKRAFTLVGALVDDDIHVEILTASSVLPRRVRVAVPSWSYTPLIGYLPDAAVPDALSADVIFAFT